MQIPNSYQAGISRRGRGGSVKSRSALGPYGSPLLSSLSSHQADAVPSCRAAWCDGPRWPHYTAALAA